MAILNIFGHLKIYQLKHNTGAIHTIAHALTHTSNIQLLKHTKILMYAG